MLIKVLIADDVAEVLTAAANNEMRTTLAIALRCNTRLRGSGGLAATEFILPPQISVLYLTLPF